MFGIIGLIGNIGMMMLDPQFCNQILEILPSLEHAYSKLILLVGTKDSGKTKVLQELQFQTGAPLLNVNLEVSRCLLEMTQRQRALRVAECMGNTVRECGNPLVLLDNLELLFDPALQLNPLKLLQGLARNQILIVAWNGRIKDGNLVYAEPGHPEYQSYSNSDLIIFNCSED
ncbi:MAG: BREX-3 system P-loop-containing protein BrxF [Syntrophomonas sp.]